MGLLDFDISKITNNPAFMLGTAIGANNTGHYGQFAPALSGGLNDYQRQAAMQKMLAEQKAQQEAQKQWMQQKGYGAGVPDWYMKASEEAKIKNQYAKSETGKRDRAQDPSGRWRYTDTGELVFPNYKAPEGGSGLPFNKDIFKQEQDLRGEWTKATNPFADVNDAYGRIQASAKNPSAAGDMALIFNYMKMLDPGSTVREGEFRAAGNAGSLPARVQAAYNNVKDGTLLTEAMRADFMARAGALYNDAYDRYEGRKKEFTPIVNNYGVNPLNVLYNRAMYPRYTSNGAPIQADPYASHVGPPQGRK